MSASSLNNKYKAISKELAKREKTCNNKVIYEYKRPKENPFALLNSSMEL